MRAGTLDRTIRIERAGLVNDAYGDPVKGWATLVDSYPASTRVLSATEALNNAEQSADETRIFNVRWSPAIADLNAKDRVIYNGRAYDIVDPGEIGRNDLFNIRATAASD